MLIHRHGTHLLCGFDRPNRALSSSSQRIHSTGPQWSPGTQAGIMIASMFKPLVTFHPAPIQVQASNSLTILFCLLDRNMKVHNINGLSVRVLRYFKTTPE